MVAVESECWSDRLPSCFHLLCDEFLCRICRDRIAKTSSLSRVFAANRARSRTTFNCFALNKERKFCTSESGNDKKTLKGKLLFFAALSQASRMRGSIFRHTPHIVCFLLSNIAHSSRFRTCSLSVQRLAPNWGFFDGGNASKTDEVDRSRRRQVFARRAASLTRLANTLNNCRVNL